MMNGSCNISGAECLSAPDHRQIIYIETPEDMMKPWNINNHFLPIMVTHAVTFLFGIAGNVVIITTMTRDKSSRNATSMFLVSLAVADLLLLVVCVPLETLHYVVITSDQEGTICKLSSYGEMLSAVASVLNLTAVSLERYIVIVYPMKSRSFCTISNCRRALIVVWLVALILSVPVTITRGSEPVIYSNNITNVTIYYCWDGDDKGGLPLAIAFYQFCIFFAVPCLLMIFCYSRVIKELWISTKTMTAMTRVSSTKFDSRGSISAAMRNNAMRGGNISPGSTTNSLLRNHSGHKTGLATSSDDVKQARKQVIKMLILVIVLFLLCWGPRVIMQLIIKHGLSSFSQTTYAVRNFFTLLPFVHSCLNPIIYSFMSSNFRRMMMRSCTGHHPCATVNSCCRSGSLRNQHKRATNTATYELSMNSEASSRVYHPSTHYPCSNTCTSDTRTSPITECETMIHEVMSTSAYDLDINNSGELGNKFHSCEANIPPCYMDKYDDNTVIM